MRERENVPQVVVERGAAGSGVGPFLLGAVLGAAAALLLAPRTGKETQEEIRKRAVRLGEGAERVVRDLQHQFEDRMEQARSEVMERVEALRGAVDTGLEAAQQARTEIEERIDRSRAAYRAAARGADGDVEAELGESGTA